MNEEKRSLTPLREIISGLLSCSDLPFNPDDARIWEIWSEIVGPAISDHAKPAFIRKGRLRVDVSEPIWIQELEFMEQTIRDRLNENLGRKAVKAIEFRLGYL